MKKLLSLLLKTLVILAALLGLYFAVQPLTGLNRVSLYNVLFPGRERLPFGESPDTAYNFSIDSLDAMFASHKINAAGEKSADKLRVVLIGDSSAWGTLLRPEETLCGQLDGASLADGRVIECYNLAYPTLSLSKDLLLLNRALEYDPDLILWSLTMESFPKDKEESNALVQANLAEYESITGGEAVDSPRESLWEQRRELADWLRLQLYGVMWSATGIDQDYPDEYTAPRTDLDADNTYHGVEGPLPDEMLNWELLEKGLAMAGDTPVVVINEPMLISSGENSKIRYNYYYPREAYDAWHEALITRIAENGGDLLDLMDLLEAERFTNSAIHYDAEGAGRIATETIEHIESLIQNGQL